MKLLVEKSDKKKNSTGSKKKHTPSQIESSEEQEDIDHLEVSSQHSQRWDVGESSSQWMAEFEWHLEVMENRWKLDEERYDLPYPSEWDMVEYPSKFKIHMLHNFDRKGSLSQH